MSISYSGIPYFPHYTANSDEIKLIQAQYGIAGYAVIFKLLERIYGGNGYYCNWSDDICLLFSVENRLKTEVVAAIVEVCIIRKIFDDDIFRRFSVLTSAEIQKVFMNAAKNREDFKINPELCLINPDYGKADKNVNASGGKSGFEDMSIAKKERELFEAFEKIDSWERCEAFIESCGMVNCWLDRLDADAIAYAFFCCIHKGKRNYSYLCGIFSNLRSRMETMLELISDSSVPLPEWLACRKRAGCRFV